MLAIGGSLNVKRRRAIAHGPNVTHKLALANDGCAKKCLDGRWLKVQGAAG